MQGVRAVLFLALALAAGWRAPALAFDPDAPNQAPPPPASVTPAAPAGALPPGTPQPAVNMKPVSLFISPDEMAQINDAIAAYKRMREAQSSNAESQAKNFLNQMEEIAKVVQPKPKPTQFTYPQFYLQTLSYQHPDDWMVMVNGEKFMAGYDNPASWLKVVMVNKESVLLEWTPRDMERVNASWMVAPGEAGQHDVTVDSLRGTVTFTLQPNQTFSSYAMRVLEGKVKPMTVWISSGAPAASVAETVRRRPDAARAPASADGTAEHVARAVAREAPPAAGTQKGVPGLSETYRKMGMEP